MRTTTISLMIAFFLLLFSINHSASSSTPQVIESFIKCLEQRANPSYPISAAIYTPTNTSFSSVLQAYIRNLRFNTSTTPKPRLIVTALHESHVQAAVVCGKSHDLQMKIRSGGHDYEGLSYVSEEPSFFVLDMFNLRSIAVDVRSETAWVETGATLGEVYYRIAEKSNRLGFPGGICPTVGVGGHVSGGGYGAMMRKYGLSADNVVDARIVDVKGKILNRKTMGEDLFWAITGGGGASFGVVLSFKLKLVPVPETVTVFQVKRTERQNALEIVHRWQYIADKLEDDLFLRMTWRVIDANGTDEKIFQATFMSLFLGKSDRLLDIMKNRFPELGLQKSDCIEMSWVESVLYWTNFPIGTPVSMLLSRTPQRLVHLKRKVDYLTRPIPKSGLRVIFDRMIELEKPTLAFNPYGGRMAEISPSEKPCPHRAGNIAKLQYALDWNETGEAAANRYINLTRSLYDYMTRFVSKSPRKAFFPYRDLDLGINHNDNNSYVETLSYGIKYFLKNFRRLVKIKTRVDPDNFFRNEQSIPIAPSRRT